jgi:hypothetical protein
MGNPNFVSGDSRPQKVRETIHFRASSVLKSRYVITPELLAV